MFCYLLNGENNDPHLRCEIPRHNAAAMKNSGRWSWLKRNLTVEEEQNKPPHPFGDFTGSFKAPWSTQIATENSFNVENDSAHLRYKNQRFPGRGGPPYKNCRHSTVKMPVFALK
jgi:hypothetical protein